MSAGIVAISLSFGYIAFMNIRAKKDGTKSEYIAIDEEGQQFLQQRRSRWD